MPWESGMPGWGKYHYPPRKKGTDRRPAWLKAKQERDEAEGRCHACGYVIARDGHRPSCSVEWRRQQAGVRLPRMFFDDHCDRLADDPDVPLPEPVRESERFVWVRRDDPGMADLISDARHYADPAFGPGHGQDTEEAMLRWHHAAKRLLAALERGS